MKTENSGRLFSILAALLCLLTLLLPGSPVVAQNTIEPAQSATLGRYSHHAYNADFYYISFAGLPSTNERLAFCNRAMELGFILFNKHDIITDSVLFYTSLDRTMGAQVLSELSHFRYDPPADAPFSSGLECTDASVACSANTYSFPAGTTGNAPPAVGGYPNYGCLSSQPCPAWFYMQVGSPGDIIIHIEKTGGTTNDVDFICWGPFASLSEGCATGLTGTCPRPGNPCCNNTTSGCVYPKGNIVDCSYDGAPQETCHILNAQVGEFYILLITNFSQQPGVITFSQTGGTGITNCNIVVFCSVLAITTNISPCNTATNTFSVSGQVEFSNPAPTGTLTVTDITAVPPIVQTFSPPFVSPLAYNLTDIPCDGAVHSLKAVFSDSTNCTLIETFSAPQPSCPTGMISGEDTICDDGTTQATVNIDITGSPGPYDFTYAIDGIPQIPVTGYNGPLPYVLSTATPGTYTLVSVINAGCPGGGTVSGSATVTVNPLPSLNFPAFDTCIDVTPFPLNMASPAGGSYSGPGVTAGLFNPAVAGSGQHTLTYTYTDANDCTNSINQDITVYDLPVVALNAFQPVCSNAAPIPLTGGTPAGGTYTGTGVSAGTFYPAVAGVGTHTITYSYTDPNGCSSSSQQPLLVNPGATVTLPVYPEVCINNAPFPLTGGLPPGGTYSGPGVSGGTFSPALAGQGSHTITYSVVDPNGCSGSGTSNIQVNPLPDVDFSGPVLPAKVCQDDPSPSRYQVPASSGTTFLWTIPPPYAAQGTIIPVPGSPHMTDVSWNGTGAAQLKLQATTNKGCTDAKTKDIFINPKPAVAITACFDLVTNTGAKPFRLKGGLPLQTPTPLQGEYLISPVTNPSPLYPDAAGNFYFDPGRAQPGTYSISYQYTASATGCPGISPTPVNITVLNSVTSCGLTMTDYRDNTTYSTAYIAGRCWMTENLRYGTKVPTPPSGTFQVQTDNCMTEKYCLSTDPNCSLYGGFYQWDEAIQFGQTDMPYQGICPPGWHIPTTQEWQTLINAVAGYTPGDAMAGSYLKDPNPVTGFHAIPNGIYYLNNAWVFTSGQLTGTFFWTSTLVGNRPVARGLNSINPSVSRYESSGANSFPVRCIKD